MANMKKLKVKLAHSRKPVEEADLVDNIIVGTHARYESLIETLGTKEDMTIEILSKPHDQGERSTQGLKVQKVKKA